MVELTGLTTVFPGSTPGFQVNEEEPIAPRVALDPTQIAVGVATTVVGGAKVRLIILLIGVQAPLGFIEMV